MRSRICIVGGIYDKPVDYRQRHVFTPETVLSRGLRTLGFEVIETGHKTFVPNDAFDIVHVHHLGKAALVMAMSPSRSIFVYTGHHDPRLLSQYHLSPVRRLLARFVMARADCVVTLSDIERDQLQIRYGRSCSNFAVIPNGVPSDVFYPRSGVRLHSGPYRILFVGQLIPQKGLDVLINAFLSVARTRDCELLLAYQTSHLEEHYRQMVTSMGLNDRVQFLGFKSAHELAELYRAVDLFVLPSYAEALPTTITEALLSGVPVVATDVGGIREQVGEHGVVVRPGDVDGLARAIDQVISDHLVLTSQAARRVRYARERFDPETMVQSHVRLYESLLASQSSPLRQRRHWVCSALRAAAEEAIK